MFEKRISLGFADMQQVHYVRTRNEVGIFRHIDDQFIVPRFINIPLQDVYKRQALAAGTAGPHPLKGFIP